jgi:hypothetical protein
LSGLPSLFAMRAVGDVAPRQLAPAGGVLFPGSWTADGKSVVFAEGPTADGMDVKLSVEGEPRVRSLIATRFNDRMPEVSPDGRWLTYVSDETGRSEVYVRAFPALGDKRQISTAGGFNPAWSRNGRKLVFLAPIKPRDGPFGMQLMEAEVTLGATFTATSPRRLFEAPFPADVARTYDLTPDAGRFIFTRETYPPSTSQPREMQVIENWFGELRRRVPAN